MEIIVLLIGVIALIVIFNWNEIPIDTTDYYAMSMAIQVENDIFDHKMQELSDINYEHNAKSQGSYWFREWVVCQELKIEIGDIDFTPPFIALTNPSLVIRNIHVTDAKEINFENIAWGEFNRLKQQYLGEELIIKQ